MIKSMNIEHDPSNGHSGNGPLLLFISTMLWAVSGFFHVLSTLTVDDVYTWVYRALSIVLVLIGLYINIPKAMEQWKKRKKKKY